MLEFAIRNGRSQPRLVRGCGTVYVAEQTEAVRRRVALKVIKLGMGTREVIGRRVEVYCTD